MLKRSARRQQTGMGLLSIALAVALSAMAAAASIGFYGTLREQVAHQQVYQDINQVWEGSQRVYAGLNSFKNVEDMLTSADILNASQIISPGVAKTADRYLMHFAAGSYQCVDCYNVIRIAIDEVDQDLCIKMAGWKFPDNQYQIEIGTTPRNRITHPRPFSASSAIASCKRFSDPMSIVFPFHR